MEKGTKKNRRSEKVAHTILIGVDGRLARTVGGRWRGKRVVQEVTAEAVVRGRGKGVE